MGSPTARAPSRCSKASSISRRASRADRVGACRDCASATTAYGDSNAGGAPTRSGQGSLPPTERISRRQSASSVACCGTPVAREACAPWERLGRADLLRLRLAAARVGALFVVHRLTLAQRVERIVLHLRAVEEDVRAVLGLDEAKA